MNLCTDCVKGKGSDFVMNDKEWGACIIGELPTLRDIQAFRSTFEQPKPDILPDYLIREIKSVIWRRALCSSKLSLILYLIHIDRDSVKPGWYI